MVDYLWIADRVPTDEVYVEPDESNLLVVRPESMLEGQLPRKG